MLQLPPAGLALGLRGNAVGGGNGSGSGSGGGDSGGGGGGGGGSGEGPGERLLAGVGGGAAKMLEFFERFASTKPKSHPEHLLRFCC